MDIIKLKAERKAWVCIIHYSSGHDLQLNTATKLYDASKINQLFKLPLPLNAVKRYLVE